MSPELLHPEKFGASDCRPTKASDCYALGMVIYEVLTGQPPFASLRDHIVARKVAGGERPERPGGVKGTWFTASLWEMLGMCWATDPQSRPSIRLVRERLKQVSSTWRPLPPQTDRGVGEDENDWDLTVLSVWILVLIYSASCARRRSHADRFPGLPTEFVSPRHLIAFTVEAGTIPKGKRG